VTDPSGDMPQITLVVCTREREQSLERCLSSIWRAAPGQPHRPIDLIVVDNSQCQTAAPVVSSMRAHPTLRVRFLHEPAKGLSRARNAALKEASTPIIAFTDDDCCLHQGYFTGLAEAFSQISGPAVIGGRVDLGDPHDLAYTIRPGTRPETFHKRLVPGGFVIGCNFAFNRPALDSIGMFDPRFGAGGILRSAEDTDYVVRAVGAGVPVIYSPAFAVSHHHGRSSPERSARFTPTTISAMARSTPNICDRRLGCAANSSGSSGDACAKPCQVRGSTKGSDSPIFPF
jgi:GT2 family glycosyltransferase